MPERNISPCTGPEFWQKLPQMDECHGTFRQYPSARGTQDQYPAHRVRGGGGSLEGLMKFLEGQKISCTW